MKIKLFLYYEQHYEKDIILCYASVFFICEENTFAFQYIFIYFLSENNIRGMIEIGAILILKMT